MTTTVDREPGGHCLAVTAAESQVRPIRWVNLQTQYSHPYSKRYWKLKVRELIVRLKKTAIRLQGRKAKLLVVEVGGGKKENY